MISFLPTQCMIFSIRFVVQSAKDFHPCKPIQKAATSHAKQKRQEFPLYRLMFIFCQRRRHDCCRTFSLLKSVHGIISPVSNLLAAASTKNKAEEFPPIPLDVFLPMQTARLPHGVSFYSNLYFASVKPIRKAATFTKSKAVQFSPIPLDVYFFQRRRHDCRRAFSLLESVHRIAPPASSLFGKLLHPRKSKRYSFHPYRLMFIFCQRRRHDCHMAFSLPESVRRIAPPMRTHEK